MQFYRCYRLNHAQHIIGVENYSAESDTEACAIGADFASAQGWLRYEVWEQVRRLDCAALAARK